MIRFGPAGWHYKDWEGIVYPTSKPHGFDPLQFLAAYFATIEINSTYYAPPLARTAARWVDRVQDFAEFLFTAKLWKRFTHERKAAWTKADVREACAALDTLHDAGKLGAVLMQFPWSFKRTDENREWLDDVTTMFRHLPLVLEVRHESWNTPQLYEALAERNIGFVNIDQPLFRSSIKPSASVTGSIGYIRVHGRNYGDWFRRNAGVEARYDYLYSREELEPWAELTVQVAGSAADTFVITNNHYRGKAVANALMLHALVGGSKAMAPPSLISAYPQALGELADSAMPI
ncbi:MAG: DUF72 domain-containing protein [Gemmatimonadaceae bacterium]|nr:DUF72 domain-containing protein [Gemmatimonadaceae bacterium]